MKSRRMICMALCVALLLFSAAPVHALAEGTVISEGAFDYRITGSGAEVTQYRSTGSSRVEIPAQVQGYPVVAIGDEVFRNLEGVTQVVLPEGILTIGERAFYACSDLESISLPQSLRSIGEMAFCNCYMLASLLIPENVESIGLSAFQNCTALQSLQVDEKNPHMTAVDNVLFTADMSTLLVYPNAMTAKGYAIPAQVRKISEKAFLECGYLETVTFPDTLIEIDKYAFSGCTALLAIQIPDSVEKIGTFAFSNCSGLTAATLGQGIEAIPAYAFYNCGNLQTVTYSETLVSIASNAFARCGTFAQICVPDTVESIEENAFQGSEVAEVRFYSTAQKERFAHLFPNSRIICLCKNPHVYLPEDLANCAVCDYALDLSAKPELASATYDTVQLAVHPSFEYSYDQTNWRADGLFTGLEPNREYLFYARIAGGQSQQVSEPLAVTTDRAPQEKAPAPILQSKDTTSVTLQAVAGCEYSMDGRTWQKEGTFTGLEMDKEYTFYQRYAQTDTHYPGQSSEPLVVKVGGNITLSSDIYLVQKTAIRKIPAGTTVQKLLSGLKGGEYCKVYMDNTLQSADALVGTGMTVKLMSGDTLLAAYTLIVTGDTNGDGVVSITDMIAVKAHILQKKLITGVFAQAADTSGDDAITITDFIQIKAVILGKGTITAR